jgi:hypothetical protein
VCKGVVPVAGSGKGVIIRVCRRVGRMGVMCTVAIIDYSVYGVCGGDRVSE